MIIDKNVKAEDVKEKTMKSLEMLDQKYSSKEVQKTNSNDTKPELDISKIRFGWH